VRCRRRLGWSWPGGELGFEEFAFFVEFGEPGADAGAVGLGGGVAGVGGQVVEFADLGFLGVVDPLYPGRERGYMGVAVGGCGGVGGGELGVAVGGAVGSEDPGGEERCGDAVWEEFGDLDGAGVVGVVGGVLGVGPVVGHRSQTSWEAKL
jgi:hypothetical protein